MCSDRKSRREKGPFLFLDNYSLVRTNERPIKIPPMPLLGKVSL